MGLTLHSAMFVVVHPRKHETSSHFAPAILGLVTLYAKNVGANSRQVINHYSFTSTRTSNLFMLTEFLFAHAPFDCIRFKRKTQTVAQLVLWLPNVVIQPWIPEHFTAHLILGNSITEDQSKTVSKLRKVTTSCSQLNYLSVLKSV